MKGDIITVRWQIGMILATMVGEAIIRYLSIPM